MSDIIRDLVHVIEGLGGLPNPRGPNSRKRTRRRDLDPEDLYHISFTGPVDGRTLWRGTTFEAALQLCNAFALLVSLCLPDLAEVKFEGMFTAVRPGEDRAAFEVKYALGKTTMRRIIIPADNDRAAASIPKEVTEFPR